MTQYTSAPIEAPKFSVEEITEFGSGELIDLCEATEAAIEDGGGFGWLTLPERDVLERFWQGVLLAPQRRLFVARLDNVICGTAQLILPPPNNQAQSHSANMMGLFISPWAREHGLAKSLLDLVEKNALERGYDILNCDVRVTQDAMIALLKGSGYQEFGRHPTYAYVEDKPIEGIFFYKELST